MLQGLGRSSYLKLIGTRVFCVLVLCLAPALGSAEAGLWDTQKKTVVLDPGHGGRDIGMTGPDASAEKTIAFTFARIMEAELKDTYRVILTRTDDYAVEVLKRTATANHEKASLFISIHAAGSLLQKRRGADLFCFDASNFSRAQEGQRPAAEGVSLKAPSRWDDLQAEHQAECRVFAELLKKTIDQKLGLPVRIHQAPLLVLKGADMPAILIEIGHLTPIELAAFTKTVCDAVFGYLK